MFSLSVVVPIYNVEAYLPACLDSLLRQNVEDLEVILVNDGSTDDSQKIIDDYVRRYPAVFRGFQQKTAAPAPLGISVLPSAPRNIWPFWTATI